MIDYEVYEEANTVKCILHGDEVKYSCARKIKQTFDRVKGNKLNFDENEFLISDEFIGMAKCSGDDVFDEKIGKDVARKKAFLKYNNACKKQTQKMKTAVILLGEELLFKCFQLDDICDDITTTIKKY